MTLFAITNVVCFDDVELLNIPLPEGLVKLCGIFRASGRMFYPVYYVLMTACIVGLARLLRRPLRLDVIERTCIIYTNAGILVIPLVRALLGADYVILFLCVSRRTARFSCGRTAAVCSAVRAALRGKRSSATSISSPF